MLGAGVLMMLVCWMSVIRCWVLLCWVHDVDHHHHHLCRKPGLIFSFAFLQGWAQDLLGLDRDQDRDLSSRDRDETETFAKLSETRPRRDPRVSETRPRRDLFLVETISRHMAYKCMVYALHTVSQKKNPLD